MTDALGQVSEIVRRHSGIVVGPTRLSALRAAIDRVRPGATPSEVLSLAGTPRGTEMLDRVVDEMTINETFFMRHRSELDAIPWARLFGDARRRGQASVRVWSAACSSGEEAYSLGILALEALPGETAAVSVLATDISRSCLIRAAQGRYGARSLRNVDPVLRRRYFEPRGDGRAEVSAELRRHVRVAEHNLVRDPAPPAGETPFDVIVCRNVLIYFDAETAARTGARLQAALTAPGLLVFGASDRLMLPRGALGPAATPSTRQLPTQRRRSPTAPDRPRIAEPPKRALAESDEPAPLARALADADAGRLAAALAAIEPILDADPLNTVALCIQGLVLHTQGHPSAALASLRRALYLDPTFARAAFELGRAQDALGDHTAAQRAYRQALEGLEDGTPGDPILGQTNDGLADACRGRLARSTSAAA